MLRALHAAMHERGSVTFFHVRGVPIRAHWTLALLLPYLAYAFSVQFESVARVAGVEGARLVLPPLIWGAILALGLFLSVALHEVAHTMVAIRFGGRVRSITLMLLGGVSQISRMPRRPRNEGLMALAGPATSLLLGALLLFFNRVAPDGPADVEMGVFYLGYMNVILGVFNLIPAFPMDGGRVLRAVLSSRIGPARATQTAAQIGQALAFLMGLAGLWTGNFLLILIAVFVYFGAAAEASAERVREALEGLRIADLVPLIRRPPATISLDAQLWEVLPRMHEAGRLDLVVTNAQGAPVTVIQAGDLTAVDPEQRADLHVGDLVAGFGLRHIVAPWNVGAKEALDRAAEQRAPYVIVADPATTSAHGLVGLLSARDIDTMIQLRLAQPPPRMPPRRDERYGLGGPPEVLPPQHAHPRRM